MANTKLTPEIASKLVAQMQEELQQTLKATTVFRSMARDRDYRDPQEEAYAIVRDFMRDFDGRGLGSSRAVEYLINTLAKLIDQRNYWQRECEGARRYMDMAPLSPPGRATRGDPPISAVAIKRQYYDVRQDRVVEYWDGKTKVVRQGAEYEYDALSDGFIERSTGRLVDRGGRYMDTPPAKINKIEPATPAKEPEPQADPVRARMQGLDFGDDKDAGK